MDFLCLQPGVNSTLVSQLALPLSSMPLARNCTFGCGATIVFYFNFRNLLNSRIPILRQPLSIVRPFPHYAKLPALPSIPFEGGPKHSEIKHFYLSFINLT